jgi:demethylmenaquinone methyltransferase/2-methoxy-6-polyprenyl-1,4-benzoquinol methylase
MFDSLVDRYDLLNDLLSLGLDRWWRRATVRTIQPRPGSRILDLGTGTGRLAARLADRGNVVAVDLSMAMLRHARRRLGDGSHPQGPFWIQASAFALPFRDGSFHAAVSGFVLRNLRDLPRAFAELARVTAPGAPIALVDITEPARPILRRVFDAYFGTVAPALGRLVGRPGAYRYLVGSIAQLPAAPEVCRMLAAAGFVGCRARPLSGGTVTLFTADRGAGPSGGSRGDNAT